MRQARAVYPSEFERAEAEAEGPGEVEQVVECYGDGDYECLAGFDSVHSGEDVYAVGCECGEEGHVEVVYRAWSSY